MMIDWFDWDRRALPLAEVHVDTGPMTRTETGCWLFRTTNVTDLHPSGKYIREVANHFSDTLPQGHLIKHFFE